jgi:hypothetical protein
VLGLCDRWKQTPDQILAIEDAPGVLRMLAIEQLARPEQEGGEF